MATRRPSAGPATVAVLGFVVAALLLAAPLSGQLHPRYDWSPDRPDGVAPIAVVGDRTYSAGELSLSYRFMGMAFDGQRVGTAPVSMAQVLDFYVVAPQRQEVIMHLLGATYGVHDRVSVELTLPFLVSKYVTTVDQDGDEVRSQTGFTGDGDRWGFGDVELRGHLSVYDEGPYRAHATLGLNVPVGSFHQSYATPATFPDETRAPYPMQIGAGTWDVMPGVTIWAMNERSSTGIQADAVLRLHDNELGYNLGHRFGGSVWGAHRVSDLVSFSGRVHVLKWLNVQGDDPNLNPDENPAADPDLRGGTRVELPLGMNVYFPDGFLEHHRLGLEVAMPIYEDLHGPQLEHGWTLTLGWEYALSTGGDG